MQIGVSVLNCSELLRHQSQGTSQDAGKSEDSAEDCEVGRGHCLSPLCAMQSLSASLQQTLEEDADTEYQIGQLSLTHASWTAPESSQQLPQSENSCSFLSVLACIHASFMVQT